MDTQKAETFSQTVTYIAGPTDTRCKWWEAIIPDELDISHLEEKAPFTYLRNGQDLELDVGTMIISSEAMHHRNDRGYSTKLGLATSKGMRWISPNMKIKQFIKENGSRELMKGSGDVIGVIRMALWIMQQEDREEAFKLLEKVS